MNKDNKLDTILASVSEAIVKCDTKAGTLFGAIGIVFGFSMFTLDEISKKSAELKTWIVIIGLLYLLVFMASVIFLTLTIFPRRKTKKEKKNNLDFCEYHEDLYKHLKDADFVSFLKAEPNEDAIIEQIKICTRIAHKKENNLRVASILISIFTFLLVCIIVLLSL